MPIVTVSVWEEFGKDQARQLIRGITESFVQVGIPAHAVQVVIHEVPRSHWGDGGRVADERREKRETPASQRSTRQDKPSRPPSSSRQQRGSRTDTRPGSRPRRGGSGSR